MHRCLLIEKIKQVFDRQREVVTSLCDAKYRLEEVVHVPLQGALSDRVN